VRIALQQQGRSSAITYETLRRQYEPPAQELNAYDPATGRFEIRGVFPGSYLLVATNEEQPRLTRVQISDKPFVPAAAYRSIEVNDADVDALSLMLAPGGALTGRVTVEGQEQSQKLTLSLPRIRLRPIFEDQLVRVSNLPDVSIESTLMVEGFEGGPFKADGKLHTNNIYPGEYNVDISGVPKGYYLKEARFNGGDVLQEPLRIAGPESGPLNIVIAPGAATIHGGLIHDQANAAGDDAADDEDNGAIVVVVPERPLRRFETLLIKQTSDTGDFTFEGLPPGDYRVVALAKDPDSPFMKPMTTETTLKARTLADQHGTLIHATGKEPLILTLRVVRPN
jgi:hypothetical protein